MDPCHHGRHRRGWTPSFLRLRIRYWEAGPRQARHGIGPGSVRCYCGLGRGRLGGRRRLEPDTRDDCGSGSYGTHWRIHRAGRRAGGD
eukprot:7747131-Heterocapsa_arctica.AAC.1